MVRVVVPEAVKARAAVQLDEYVFLSPEWIREVTRVVQSVREADPYFRNRLTDYSLNVVYVIRNFPGVLRNWYGGGGQGVIFVRLDQGIVHRIEIGRAPPTDEVDLIVTIEYGVAKQLLLGESGLAATLMNGQVKAEPANGFRRWPTLAAKSLVTASRMLKIARTVPSVFQD